MDAPPIGVPTFTDERINAIQDGTLPMTPAEREFLVTDTPRFEECRHVTAALSVMSDADLMQTAQAAWMEFASMHF